MNRKPRAGKIRRLRAEGRPRVLDLFAGCGGLSLGFHRTGFEIVSAIETDPLAAASHRLNFHGSLENILPAHLARDITKVKAEELMAESAPGTLPNEAIDVIVGGPPCQAFARVGRAKLREVHDHPTAFKQDPRGNLYLRYLDYVQRLQPVAILMENVPDVINYGGHNIAEETCEVLSSMGYVCRYTLLNTVYYGVPQTRERMFLLAFARRDGCEPRFITPTRWISLPLGARWIGGGRVEVHLRQLKERPYRCWAALRTACHPPERLPVRLRRRPRGGRPDFKDLPTIAAVSQLSQMRCILECRALRTEYLSSMVL